jgi:hypothetical protein
MNTFSELTRAVDPREDAKRMCDDPAAFFDHSHTDMQTIPRELLERLQLAGLKYRFDDLRARIPMLGKLADKQGIGPLQQIDDVVPLLFEHTMYKAYPPALLEHNRFSDINRWLTKLTCHDLTGIDVSKCESIDEWLAVMDDESPLEICHSSGTSGTMSFLPCSKAEWDKYGKTVRTTLLQQFGAKVDPPGSVEIYCVHPYFRSGGSAHLRFNDLTAKFIVGSEERLLAAYPARMSSDVLYLSAKMRAAQAKGELDRLRISPKLLERKREFVELEASMPAHLETFLDRVTSELHGKRIYLSGTWNLLHGMAKRGLEKGFHSSFARNSIVMTFGGAKGGVPPPGWQEDVCKFIGVSKLQRGYGMSEVMGMHQMCELGNYHFVPWVVPFLLDPETSDVLPRLGTVTGRAAFFDLGADTRWGGFISGDQITVNWDEPCGCGRTSVYIEGDIQRFSEKNGGDDKISCAATENAHKEAMDFLTNFE